MKATFLALLLVTNSAFALEGTGSVSFVDDVVPILESRPVFKKFVLCNFDIVSDPMGVRIGGPTMPHMGGARMGPYSMYANWHGGNGDVRMILTINTNVKFFDKNGREVKGGGLRAAAKLTETFDSIEVNPPEPDQPTSEPGGFKYLPDATYCKSN